MPPVESTPLPVGFKAPDFTLPDYSGVNPIGTPVSLESFRGVKVMVVVFMCNHCPFVKHVLDEIARLGHDCHQKGLGFVAINPNDAQAYPEDAPEKMTELARRYGFEFPYLYDEDQSVAKAYRAACTPDFYVFDANFALAYHGQLDDSRPGQDDPVNGRDLRLAIDAVMNGQEIDWPQKPSIGCSIKWKPGNAPE
ncbi:MAG: thioredoxin family protein [Phycisphaerales bacterium]|nr:MAG: thioredoxin family protein [Phycisphaerales bacterium]